MYTLQSLEGFISQIVVWKRGRGQSFRNHSKKTKKAFQDGSDTLTKTLLHAA